MSEPRGTWATSIIPWSQVELDGRRGAPPETLRAGAAWRWTGAAVRLGGARVLELGRSRGPGGGAGWAGRDGTDDGAAAGGRGLTVTDGRTAWALRLVPAGAGRTLAVADGEPPPAGVDLWVAQADAGQGGGDPAAGPGGALCFTPGTAILTPDGPRPVESLREGDRVQTADDGPAEILWIAGRRASGARLAVMPWLAPVRLRAGALGGGVPDAGLLLSPDHRVRVAGPRAAALWGEAEVLVAARDLVDGRRVVVERPREVTYIHLLLARHAVLFANGVACDSFWPCEAALEALGACDRARLLARLGGVAGYGPPARRVLGAGEAAILLAA